MDGGRAGAKPDGGAVDERDAAMTGADAGRAPRLPESGTPPPFGDLMPDPRFEDPFFWEAPVELAEEVGFGASNEPLCSGEGDVQYHSLWGDGTGLYLLVGVAPEQAEGIDFVGGGTRIYHHDTKRWELFLDELRSDDQPAPPLWQSAPPWSLTGFAGEAPLRYGAVEDCGLQSLQDAQPECLAKVPIDAVAIAGTAHGYAVGSKGLFEKADDGWTLVDAELTRNRSLRAIWAGDDTVVAVGDSQQVVMRAPGQQDFVWLTGVPAGDYRLVWGFGPDDIWAVTVGGQLTRYDGASWHLERSELLCPRSSGDEPRQIWGDEMGALYILTTYRLLKHVEGALTPLIELDCGRGKRLTSMWAKSSRELFVSVVDNAYGNLECGESFVLYFDGQELRRI